MAIDHTHDEHRRSWVASANGPGADFPLQNLPFGVFSPPSEGPRCGVAIGDRILDLRLAAARGLLRGPAAHAVTAETLDSLFALGRTAMRDLRHDVFALLDSETGAPDDSLLHEAAACALHLPTSIPGFTDFYTGIYHAMNCGQILGGPQFDLSLNYHHMPIAYNGRASTVVVSGTELRRPLGMRKRLEQDLAPTFGPSSWFDFELEMGCFVGGNPTNGRPIGMEEAADRVVGFCLLNDWSARDIQMFEMPPLGPFNGKSTGTTISPWVVTADALEPFRSPVMQRPSHLPQVPDYLIDPRDQQEGLVEVTLAATISTTMMRAAGAPPTTLLTTQARYMYWSFAQMLAHHAVAGCVLKPGDLLGTGTLSGPTPAEAASLFELSTAGRTPIVLPNEESRAFLADGDEITFTGRCRRDGFASIGFGVCAGRVAPAVSFPASQASA